MRDSERGSAAVEFALVVPVLLVFLLTMVQVGLLLRDQLMVVQAARAGAREASVGAADEEVRAAAADAAAALDPARIQVGVTRAGAQGDPVTVRIDYEMVASVPFIGWFFPPAVGLSAQASMRQEFAP